MKKHGKRINSASARAGIIVTNESELAGNHFDMLMQGAGRRLRGNENVSSILDEHLGRKRRKVRA